MPTIIKKYNEHFAVELKIGVKAIYLTLPNDNHEEVHREAHNIRLRIAAQQYLNKNYETIFNEIYKQFGDNNE